MLTLIVFLYTIIQIYFCIPVWISALFKMQNEGLQDTQKNKVLVMYNITLIIQRVIRMEVYNRMARIDRNFDSQQQSLHGRVYEKLENDILTGKYKSGDYLSEQKLSDELGVSRTPIREAFRQLEHEGFVIYSPNRGVIVRGFSEEDIKDIYTIRLMIEGMTARRATENITQDQLEDLKETIELEEFYTKKGDARQLSKIDSRFHEIIYIASGSHFLTKTLKNFHHYIGKTRSISLSNPERAQQSYLEHKGIYEAISSKDREMAEILMEEHIRNANSYIEKNKHMNK